MPYYKILNTLILKGCEEAVKEFEGIGEMDTVPQDYNKVFNVIDQYDAYLASLPVRIDSNMISKASKLKVIGTPSTGTDHLDLLAIDKAGIKVFDISKEYALINSFTATAELAFALILDLNRKTYQARDSVLKGTWPREVFSGFQLSEKRLGILGLGRLGKISAKIGLGFNMRVIACDPNVSQYPGVDMVDFNTLMESSDILTVHIHLNEKTKKIINCNAISKMKNNAILINTSRGGLIDEEALLEALKSGKIKGAGLDVIDGEWMSNISNHPLVDYAKNNENIIILPHIGGATKESILGARIFILNKVANYLENLNYDS